MPIQIDWIIRPMPMNILATGPCLGLRPLGRFDERWADGRRFDPPDAFVGVRVAPFVERLFALDERVVVVRVAMVITVPRSPVHLRSHPYRRFALDHRRSGDTVHGISADCVT